jgi:small subunit ribosomal protein S10
VKELSKPQVRIKLMGFDHKILDQSAEQVVEALERTGAVVAGPVPLPTHIKKYSVIRSAFIDKDSQEQFEIRTHKRLIDIVELTSKTVDSLANLNLPSGVSIDIKS